MNGRRAAQVATSLVWSAATEPQDGSERSRRTRRDEWGDAKHDPDLRVLCDAPSHGRTVVATFRRPVGGDLQRLPDVLSCRQCGLRLTVSRDDFNEWLERLHKAGVSEVGLPALVAIMTKRSST
jgi:hypothetical protein